MKMQTAGTGVPAYESVAVLPNGRVIRFDAPSREKEPEASPSESREPQGKRGSWLFRAVAPLIAGIALLRCGAATSFSDDEKPDVKEETDVPQEEDAPDVQGEADVAETPDEAVEDAPTEAEEDAGTEDAPPEEEDAGPDEATGAEDAPDFEFVDVPDGGDIIEVEAEGGGCTETTRTETTPLPGPMEICGSTQTTTTYTEIVTTTGPDCETPGTTRTMVRKAVEIRPPLDTGDLGCARGTIVRALNGEEVIITLEPARLESATEFARAVGMRTGDILDGGAAEYKLYLTDVSTPIARTSLLDADWNTVRSAFYVYETGYATIDIRRGAISWNLVDPNVADMAYTGPPNARESGGTEYWTSGDGWPFAFYTVVVGTQLQGWEWVRSP
ncbi:MAG: hypothetical protein AB1657_03300 [Candidatus Micrarchaeota archaeon]